MDIYSAVVEHATIQILLEFHKILKLQSLKVVSHYEN